MFVCGEPIDSVLRFFCWDIASQTEESAIKPTARINDQIRAKSVRLISQEGEQLGVVATEDALQRAKEAQLDLVEVAPNADPPVCRIYDYRKVMYEQKRRLKASRKKAKSSELKECKMRVTIDAHDRDTKLRKVRKFLENGDKVKFTFQYRGREVTKPQLGQQLVSAVLKELEDIAEMEKPPSQTGKFMHMIVTRRKDWKPEQANQEEDKAATS
ncbi:translation initiation factor IF-3 [bacterium]|nr:translation initiation factor IF-3 [bacterium]